MTSRTLKVMITTLFIEVLTVIIPEVDVLGRWLTVVLWLRFCYGSEVVLSVVKFQEPDTWS